MSIPLSLDRELGQAAVSAPVELFELDATMLGADDVLYFYPAVKADLSRGSASPVYFDGRRYDPYPVEASGFELSYKGDLPRPSLRFSNVTSLFTSLVLRFDDLCGAKITRRRTFARFLDASEVPSEANRYAELPPDIFYIERKVLETSVLVEFELGCVQDLAGFQLPRRVVAASMCGFIFRGPECGYSELRHSLSGTSEGVPLADLVPTPYFGPFTSSRTYVRGDCVQADNSGFVGIYRLLAASWTGPTNFNEASTWSRIQRWRGNCDLWQSNPDGSGVAYNPFTGTGLVNPTVAITRGDLVQIRMPQVVRLFIRTGTDISPYAYNQANPLRTSGWLADVCNKSLSACRAHFDPARTNQPLPFGGFPGTSRLPV